MPDPATAEIKNTEVAAAFDDFPPEVRDRLLSIRDIIFETAASLPEVGTIEEALRWGQPAYLTSESKSGTTIRLGATANQATIFVNCRTTLVNSFRQLFDEIFEFDGDRAVIVPNGRAIPAGEVAECAAMALTYHRSAR